MQLLRMVCENRPQWVAKLVAKDSKLLQRFFSGDSRRILLWFQNFAGAGQNDHQRGARALARYAFLHREECWHELEWKGSHAQAPATVAAKPHYFLELDVLESVNNFLEQVPGFWRSEELKDSLKDGEFLSLNYTFFTQELLKMVKDQVSEGWQIVKDYVADESFFVLCQQILHIVKDRDFLTFINELGLALSRVRNRTVARHGSSKQAKTGSLENVSQHKSTSWIELVMFEGLQWNSLEELVFCNACISHGRNLWRLLQEEEHEEEAHEMKSHRDDMNLKLEEEEREHWALRYKVLKLRKPLACKFLAIESWRLYYQLLVLPMDKEAFEALLTDVELSFRCSSTLLEADDDRKHRSPGRVRSRKRFKKRRKDMKREKFDLDDDETLTDSEDHVAGSNSVKSLSIDDCSWFLSIDNYTLAWTKADLVEHVVAHAVQQWFQWCFTHW
jgi:hypothetical protein